MKKITTLFFTCLLASVTAHAQFDVAIADIGPLDYQVPGTHNFHITLKNAGTTGVGTVDIYWQFGNGPVNSVSKKPMDVKWSAPVGLIHDAGFVVTFPGAGNYQIKAWVKSIYQVDNNASNDTMTKNIRVLENLPKKNVVLEVFKHQKCGPCYDAANYVDTFISLNKDYAIVGIYTVTSDKLYNAEGDVVDSHYGFSHPMPLFDRFKFPFRSKIGVSFYHSVPPMPLYALGAYGEREHYFEPVQVFFSTVNWNAATRQLKVKLGAKFYDDLDGDYRFNLYLTEDGIKGYQASAPDPENFIHNHVARAMLGGPWGEQGSLPAVIKNKETKFHEFTYTIPENYDINKIHLLALVQTYNADDMQRRILNSVQKTFQQALSVQNEVLTANPLSIYPNPAKNQLTISWGSTPRPYQLRILDMTGRIYNTLQCTGTTQVNIRELPAGTYIICADDGHVVHTQAFVKE